MPTLKTEILAGFTTFFTMVYIVFVNPAILSTEGTGLPFSGVLTATVLVCFSMTLLMGIYANLPFAVAPGMGINAFFTFTIILGKNIPWQTALGMVFWSGVLFVVISATPIREKIALAIPKQIRIGAAVGIGLFLSFIGLKNLGIVVSDPVTFVKLGNLGPSVLIGLGSTAVMLFLLNKKSPFAFLTGMALATLAAIIFGFSKLPETYFSAPDFSLIMQLDILGSLKLALLPAIISLMFTDLFDSISTFIGVSHACNLLDKKGNPINLRQGLMVDALATLSAALFGTSSGTAYIESASGIEVGGRTGRTAIVTALCFLPCLVIAPLAQVVPACATAPVLVIVGALMFRSIGELNLKNLEDLVPAFLTILLIPLTFSITQGILWGFVSHTGLYLLVGRRKELKPEVFVITAIAVALLWVEHA